MKLVLASVIAAISVGLVSKSSDPTLDAYTAKLHAAKSLQVEFTLGGNGAPVKCSLSYSSPNKLRIETPEKLSVSDGTTLWVLDKSNNTYTESKAAATAPAMADEVYAWRGFFAKSPYEDATDIAMGAKRTISGVEVQAYALTLPRGKSATLYIETATGLAHGSMVTVGDKRLTALASKVQLGDSPLADSVFAFSPPDGAKKVEAPVVALASFASAEAVFKQYCTGCHGSDTKKAGLDISTYDAIMAGRNGRPVVVAGDPSMSRLVQVMAGPTKKMPPGDDSVPADAVKAVSDWIQAGAKAQ